MTSQARPNPYVGPRAFEVGETLYARDREVKKLLNLLIAKRIVLLYSPSGAGKTSLVQAALIPALKKENFRVLPVIRLGLGRESDHDLPSTVNRYVLATLLSLEEDPDIPPEQKKSLAELADMDLVTYLEQRLIEVGEADEQVLIFDQFEEILTVALTDQKDKEAFFTQLGRALRHQKPWALFAMREEYLAALDPYLRLVPTQFRTTFRLELLREEAARQAIQKPAQNEDVPFTDAAAAKLTEDLRQSGIYIEPVQLQVVCHRLWEKLPMGTMQIGKSQVDALGNVDQALADYYTDRVRIVSEKTHVSERTIREWFDAPLITEQGIRGQVMREPEQSHGLSNQAIDLLVDAHLVRVENRRGLTWYELAHDRLIEPVRRNNADWFQANLSTLQRRADLWRNQGGPSDLLLRNEALVEAERWAADHQDELTSTEQDFLADCQKARAIVERERKQTRRIRWLAIVSTIVSIIAIIAFSVAFYFFVQARQAEKTAVRAKNEAKRLRRVSIAQALAAQALSRQDETGALLARQAYLLNQQNQGHILAQVDHTLRTILNGPTFNHPLGDHRGKVLSVAFSPDGETLASGAYDNTVRLWDLRNPGAEPTVLDDHEDGVFWVAFSPDGKILASGSDDTTVRLWDPKNLDAEPAILHGHVGGISCITFSPDGRTLASGSDDATIRLWDLQNPGTEPTVLEGHEEGILSIAFSPDGETLASGAYDNTVQLWDLRNPGTEPTVLDDHEDRVFSVAFSPDGKILASGSSDKTIRLRDPQNPGVAPTVLDGHEKGILSIAFSPDGKTLVSSGYDGTVRLWDLYNFSTDPITLPVQGGLVFSVAFSSDGQLLASGALDNTVQLWDLQQPSALPTPLRGHEDYVWSVTFSPKNQTLASGSKDGTVRLWELDNPSATPTVLPGHKLSVTTVAFSPDDRTLASGSGDATIRLWNLRNLDADLPTLRDSGGTVNSIAFSPDGKTLASGSDDNIIRLWDLQTTDLKLTIPSTHEDSISSIAFSPNGKILASGSDDTTVRLWDLKNLAAEPIILDHEGIVSSIAFSPDGKILASGSMNKTVRLWDLDNPVSFTLLPGHTDRISSVAFSPDGETLASGSKDKTVRLWDLKNPGNDPIVLRSQNGAVLSVQFGPDGQTLASGYNDGTILIWAITKNLTEKICQKVWRNLTLDDWQRFVGPDITYERTCPNLPPGEGAPLDAPSSTN